MTAEPTPTDIARSDLDDLDDSTALRLTDPEESIVWELDDENVHYLTKNDRGTWYPRPTILSHEMAVEILSSAEYEEIDPEEIPDDRREV